MDYIYGKLNQRVKLISYGGSVTETAITRLNDADKTFSVDVLQTPGSLIIRNPNREMEEIRYRGSSDVFVDIPVERFVRSMTLHTCTEVDKPVAGYQVGDHYLETVFSVAYGEQPEEIIYTSLAALNLDFNYKGSKYVDVDTASNEISLKLKQEQAGDSLLTQDEIQALHAGAGEGSFVQNVPEVSEHYDTAEGRWSTALGKGTAAYGGGSLAEGGGAQAGVSYEDFLALFSLEDSEQSQHLYLNACDRASNTIDVATPEEAGYRYWFAHAQNEVTKALGRGSDASGLSTVAEADYSHVGGYHSRNTKGAYASRTDGYKNTTTGKYASTDGDNNVNNAQSADVSGTRNQVDVVDENDPTPVTKPSTGAVVAGGQNVVKNAPYASAFGYQNKVYNDSSAALNAGNVVSTQASTATGYYNEMSGNGHYSFVSGRNNKVTGWNQRVHGKFNNPNPNLIDMVGIGESEDDRRNGYELDRQGNAWFAGDVHVGAPDESEPNSNRLVEQRELDAQISGVREELQALSEEVDTAQQEIATARGSYDSLNARLTADKTAAAKALQDALIVPNIRAEGDSAGNVPVIAGAYVDDARSDKTFCYPASKIAVEISRQAGVWEPFEDADIYKLFTHRAESYQWKPFSDDTVLGYRIKLANTASLAERYVSLNAFYIRVAGSGVQNASTVSIKAKSYAGTELEVIGSKQVWGSPTGNVFYFKPFYFGGWSQSGSSNYGELVIEITRQANTTAGVTIDDIRFFGQQVFKSDLYMVSYDRAYQVKSNGKDVAFQGTVAGAPAQAAGQFVTKSQLDEASATQSEALSQLSTTTQQTLSTLQSDLDKLEGDVSADQAALAQFQQKYEQDLQSLQEQDAANSSAIGGVASNVAANAEAIAEVASNVAANADAITGVASNVAETKGALAVLQKQVANINGLYSAFESVSGEGAAINFPSQEEKSSAPYVRATSLEGLKELQLLPWGQTVGDAEFNYPGVTVPSGYFSSTLGELVQRANPDLNLTDLYGQEAYLSLQLGNIDTWAELNSEVDGFTGSGGFDSAFTISEETLDATITAYSIEGIELCSFTLNLVLGSTPPSYHRGLSWLPKAHSVTCCTSLNILPSDYQFSNGTINGVTVTKQADGSILLNGTATSNISLFLFGKNTAGIPGGLSLAPGSYYIGYTSSTGAAVSFYLKRGDSDWVSNKTFTTSVNDAYYPSYLVYMMLSKDTVYNRTLIRPYIVRGTTAPVAGADLVYKGEVLDLPLASLPGWGWKGNVLDVREGGAQVLYTQTVGENGVPLSGWSTVDVTQLLQGGDGLIFKAPALTGEGMIRAADSSGNVAAVSLTLTYQKKRS